jgi:2-polyprenyl-3-methyl-5-hydroxy-6-metoxy-1,4-benzoquinol methylase
MTDITNNDVIAGWEKATLTTIEQHGDEGDFARRYLLNPAIFSLLGDIRNKAILDAGCGQGYLSRLLAQKGAAVTGIEPAKNWLQFAQEREQKDPLGITYYQKDLSTLTKLSNTFDFVVANMVFMDIPDYESAIHNCIAALKHDGNLIFSITHPCFEEPASEWIRKGHVATKDYFRTYTIPSVYGHWFHRPLSAYVNLLIHEGCCIQQMIEPQLSLDHIQNEPAHERNVFVPQFLLIKASKQ